MSIVDNYILRCITENTNVTTWGTSSPVSCPNNTNHSIDVNSIAIIGTIQKNSVIVEEDSNGYFETTHFVNEIPAGETGAISTHDISWDFDITLWRTALTVTQDMIGDEIQVVASPETVVGVVTSQININDSIINVSPTVIANTQRGFQCVLDDGVNKFTTEIKSIDKTNNQITLKNNSPYNYTVNTPVKIGIFLVRYLQMHNTETYEIGLKGLKGKEIKTGTVLRIYYKNNNGTFKKIFWRSEYYNNG